MPIGWKRQIILKLLYFHLLQDSRFIGDDDNKIWWKIIFSNQFWAENKLTVDCKNVKN